MTHLKIVITPLIVILLIVAGCKGPQSAVKILKPIGSEEFLQSPFGHNESIESFKKNLPSGTKIRKLARKNIHYPSKIDTIYQFMYKGSEIFVYKSNFNKEILMAGSISNPQIKLTNGITTGITRDQFYKALEGVKKSEADTLKLSTSRNDRNFSFIFRKGKLRKIKFESYLD